MGVGDRPKVVPFYFYLYFYFWLPHFQLCHQQPLPLRCCRTPVSAVETGSRLSTRTKGKQARPTFYLSFTLTFTCPYGICRALLSSTRLHDMATVAWEGVGGRGDVGGWAMHAMHVCPVMLAQLLRIHINPLQLCLSCWGEAINNYYYFYSYLPGVHRLLAGRKCGNRGARRRRSSDTRL